MVDQAVLVRRWLLILPDADGGSGDAASRCVLKSGRGSGQWAVDNVGPSGEHHHVKRVGGNAGGARAWTGPDVDPGGIGDTNQAATNYPVRLEAIMRPVGHHKTGNIDRGVLSQLQAWCANDREALRKRRPARISAVNG